MYNILNLNDEYNLQNEFIKIRKLFVNIFTFELYYVEYLKLKNIFLELLKNENISKSSKESKSVKRILSLYKKEYCLKKNDDIFELKKNICFIEKEILNRLFQNITIKNSNFIIKQKFAYLYNLFRNFYFLLVKGKGNTYRKKRFFLCNFYIKKFSILLNYLINVNKKNIYYEYIKKQLQKYSNTKEKTKKKKKNGHCIYVYKSTNPYKSDKNNSKKNKINKINKINHLNIINYTYKMSSYNYCIDRKRNKYYNLSSNFINKLKIDISNVKYVIKKAVYNDFYFNVLNCIFYSFINRSIYFISNSLYSLYSLERTENNEKTTIKYNNKSPLNKLKRLNSLFTSVKILFISSNMYQKYVKNELFFDELFLFKHIRILLKENIEKLLFITIVNINRLYIQLSFKYLFNLFLFYFIFLDINFFCSFFLVHNENNLTNKEIRFCKYLTEVNENKNCKKYHKKENNYEKENHNNYRSNNNNYRSNNNNNNRSNYNNNNKEEFYTLCFFCSFNKLKKENLNVIEKKKYFIFIIICILRCNYTTKIKYQDSLFSYFFNNFVNKFFYFENFQIVNKHFNKKPENEVDHSYKNCYYNNKNKIKKNFNIFFNKLNKKNAYLKSFYNIIYREELTIYNSHRKREYTYSKVNKSNIQNNSNKKNTKKKNNLSNNIHILSPKNDVNNIIFSHISNTTYTEDINIFYYLTSTSYKNKIIENIHVSNKSTSDKKLNEENNLHHNFYPLKKENKIKNISRTEEKNGCNNNLYYYINEKMKTFFENLKILLFPLLNKLYNKSIFYLNLHIYLFIVYSSFLLDKMKKENILKIKEITLTKKRKTFLNNIINELCIYKYFDFLNLLCNNKYIILKKLKNKKIFLYLKSNLKNFNKWHIMLVYRIENFINVYRYKLKGTLEKNFFLLENKKVDNRKYKNIYVINYICYLKKGKNTSIENRKNKLITKRKKNFIKINKNNCLEKYISLLYRSIRIFHNIYINISEDHFYIQTKKDFIIFNLKSKINNHEIRDIYYEFKGKKYYVFENLYILKKTYKIHYINLCVLFYRYCFFFYKYNPLIFSFLFNNIYCICIKCLNKYLIIKYSARNNIEKEEHDCFYKQNGILIKNRNNIFIKTFYYLVFFLIVRYHTFIGNINHSGSQNCIPKRIMNILEKELKIKRECFSSPFNAVLKKYCSFFNDIDIFFGSSGNFFEFNLHSGTYEVNPPFDIFLINKLIIYILHNLKKELYELTFFLIIPFIKDKNYFYELLFSSPYVSYYFFLQGNSYTFSTRLFDKREKEYISTCDCFVFILQNNRARTQKKIHKNVLLKIKNLWKT